MAYSATTVIEIKPRRRTETSAPGLVIPEEVENVFEVVKSPCVLSPIITDLSLDRIWAERLNRPRALPIDKALDFLGGKLKLELKPGTNCISITVTDDAPTVAARIANAIADRYKTMRDSAFEQLTALRLEDTHQKIAMQEEIASDARARSEQTPEDAYLQAKNLHAQDLLAALKLKLQRIFDEARSGVSQVKIVSRATTQPE